MHRSIVGNFFFLFLKMIKDKMIKDNIFFEHDGNINIRWTFDKIQQFVRLLKFSFGFS